MTNNQRATLNQMRRTWRFLSI